MIEDSLLKNIPFFVDLKYAHDEVIELHPNGFLQLGLHLGCTTRASRSVRLHVWSNKIIQKGSSELMIHDHKFDLESKILLGRIHNTTYDLQESDDGDYFVTKVDYSGGSAHGNSINVKVKSSFAVNRGESYVIPRYTFHSAQPVEDLTATLMVRSNNDESKVPRVLTPSSHKPTDLLYDRSIDQDFAWGIIYEAVEKIKEHYF